jgi:DNA-binding NtrC family response regulator
MRLRPRVRAGRNAVVRPTLLVVDDETSIHEVVRRFAHRSGFDVVACASGRETFEYLERRTADVALVDLQMPEIGGLDVLDGIRQRDPQCQTILMTGNSTVESAIRAIRLGALDYLTKPLDFERLARLLATVQADQTHRQAVVAADSEAARHLEFAGMIGRDAKMQELFGMIRRLAPHARTALITGETGTGKELVARAMHTLGARASRKFVPINCSAVVETLFESELFGHVRGAFTGATENKTGLFEAADGGTIFLDEIGELPLAVQAKLLRILETGDVQRVGSVQAKRVDVHVVAATNRQLGAEAAAGRFRPDLYYRLNVVELHVPPLRERRDDIPYLVAAFVRDCARRIGKEVTGVTAGAERLLMASAWPGNIRELRNVIERGCMMTDGELISERDVMPDLKPLAPAQPLPATLDGAMEEPTTRLDSVERSQIVKVLTQTRGNKAAAARALGVSRRALYRKLERHGLAQHEQP